MNNFRHEDGAWGWWETDESHPSMTAYVVAGLAQAKGAGVHVDADRIEKGVQWTGEAFAADARLAGDLRAYMQYALAVAGKPDANGLGQVFEQRSKLSPYGMDGEQAWWPATRDHLLDFSEDATPGATAYAVNSSPTSGGIPRCCPRRRCG